MQIKSLLDISGLVQDRSKILSFDNRKVAAGDQQFFQMVSEFSKNYGEGVEVDDPGTVGESEILSEIDASVFLKPGTLLSFNFVDSSPAEQTESAIDPCPARFVNLPGLSHVSPASELRVPLAEEFVEEQETGAVLVKMAPNPVKGMFSADASVASLSPEVEIAMPLTVQLVTPLSLVPADITGGFAYFSKPLSTAGTNDEKGDVEIVFSGLSKLAVKQQKGAVERVQSVPATEDSGIVTAAPVVSSGPHIKTSSVAPVVLSGPQIKTPSAALTHSEKTVILPGPDLTTARADVGSAVVSSWPDYSEELTVREKFNLQADNVKRKIISSLSGKTKQQEVNGEQIQPVTTVAGPVIIRDEAVLSTGPGVEILPVSQPRSLESTRPNPREQPTSQKEIIAAVIDKFSNQQEERYISAQTEVRPESTGRVMPASHHIDEDQQQGIIERNYSTPATEKSPSSIAADLVSTTHSVERSAALQSRAGKTVLSAGVERISLKTGISHSITSESSEYRNQSIIPEETNFHPEIFARSTPPSIRFSEMREADKVVVETQLRSPLPEAPDPSSVETVTPVDFVDEKTLSQRRTIETASPLEPELISRQPETNRSVVGNSFIHPAVESPAGVFNQTVISTGAPEGLEVKDLPRFPSLRSVSDFIEVQADGKGADFRPESVRREKMALPDTFTRRPVPAIHSTMLEVDTGKPELIMGPGLQSTDNQSRKQLSGESVTNLHQPSVDFTSSSIKRVTEQRSVAPVAASEVSNPSQEDNLFAMMKNNTPPVKVKAQPAAGKMFTVDHNMPAGTDQLIGNAPLSRGGENSVEFNSGWKSLGMEQRIVGLVVERLNFNHRPTAGSISLRLNSHEVGHLRIGIEFKRDRISVQLQVQNQHVYDILNNHIAKLRETLEQQGFVVGDLLIDRPGDQPGNGAFLADQRSRKTPSESALDQTGDQREELDDTSLTMSRRAPANGGLSLFI